jgi:ABC-type transporter Mla subunit MlaD
MVAEPGYDDLDRRLSAVEEFQDHVLPHDLAATRGAVGILHTDLRAASREVTRSSQRLDQVAAEVSAVARAQIEHGAALAQLAATVDGHTTTLAEHGEMLREILRRLPAGPDGG